MSLELLDDAGTSEAFSDPKWMPRELPQRPAFKRSAQHPASFESQQSEVYFGRDVLKFDEEPPEWLWQTILTIASFGSLRPNWDSYGARTVDPFCAIAAINLLLNAMTSSMPLPSVVPTNRGGVQLEWHCNEVDFEIEFSSPTRLRIAFEDFRTREIAEQEIIGGDLRPLQPLLQRLTQIT